MGLGQDIFQIQDFSLLIELVGNTIQLKIAGMNSQKCHLIMEGNQVIFTGQVSTNPSCLVFIFTNYLE